MSATRVGEEYVEVAVRRLDRCNSSWSEQASQGRRQPSLVQLFFHDGGAGTSRAAVRPPPARAPLCRAPGTRLGVGKAVGERFPPGVYRAQLCPAQLGGAEGEAQDRVGRFVNVTATATSRQRLATHQT
ncbi:hypothetical protein [Streptomyces massasporeus]|uniref:hypothetical protein n=1 Tax=Streptomyces massasporeus TaxID=67324 RepID=UPI00364D7D38